MLMWIGILNFDEPLTENIADVDRCISAILIASLNVKICSKINKA